jgi:hypothetical protein
MKSGLLIAGIFICGTLAVARVWGLIFLEFSIKQLIYAGAFACAAIGMIIALRNRRAGPGNET